MLRHTHHVSNVRLKCEIKNPELRVLLFVFQNYIIMKMFMNELTAKYTEHLSYSLTVVNQLNSSKVSNVIRITFPSDTVTRQVISTSSVEDPLFTMCRYE